jgi:hypothetical protein
MANLLKLEGFPGVMSMRETMTYGNTGQQKLKEYGYKIDLLFNAHEHAVTCYQTWMVLNWVRLGKIKKFYQNTKYLGDNNMKIFQEIILNYINQITKME